MIGWHATAKFLKKKSQLFFIIIEGQIRMRNFTSQYLKTKILGIVCKKKMVLHFMQIIRNLSGWGQMGLNSCGISQ